MNTGLNLSYPEMAGNSFTGKETYQILKECSAALMRLWGRRRRCLPYKARFHICLCTYIKILMLKTYECLMKPYF
jgi:hypothetical protein